MRISALAVMTALLSLTLVACQGPPPTCNPSGTDLHISVEEGTTHLFDKECLAAPANQPFTIEFQNHDTSSHGNHNVHILEGNDSLFVGDIARHETSITYEVGPLPVGMFRFKCDSHPEMNGTFIVE